MTTLSQVNLASNSNLATGNWKSVVVWKYCFLVIESALDASLVLLANRDAWWWPECLLHLLSFASSSTCFSNVHVLLQLGRVLFFGPLAIRSHYFSSSLVIPCD